MFTFAFSLLIRPHKHLIFYFFLSGELAAFRLSRNKNSDLLLSRDPRRPRGGRAAPPPLRLPVPLLLLPPAVAGVLRRPLAGRPRWRRASRFSPPVSRAARGNRGAGGAARWRRSGAVAGCPGATRVAEVVVVPPLVAGHRRWPCWPRSGPCGPDLG